MKMNELLAMFAGTEALVEPSRTARFEACLAGAVEHPRFGELASVDATEDFWGEDSGWCRPYVIADGILQIPVKGVLLNDFPYAFYSYATGYDYIWQAFKRGCGDFATGTIRGIAFIEDTPGGMVAGCFDAVDRMVALKAVTGVPVRAFAHESAYSAGYAVATVADHIAVSRTGGVGSIGVVTGHVDVSGAMEQAGLKFTYIASDPSKIEGNPYEELSDDARARIQARIDELYGIFVAAVARGRGLEESVIRNDLKAYCYTATQATSNGLADSVGSLEDATSAFAGFLDDQSDNDGDDNMTTSNTAVDQATHDATVTTARAEGNAAGVASERTRISAILTAPEAEGRDALANHLAFKGVLPAEDAIAMLAAAEKKAPAPAAAVDPFAASMDTSRQPKVGGDAGGSMGTESAEDEQGARVLGLIRGANLPGFKPAAQR